MTMPYAYVTVAKNSCLVWVKEIDNIVCFITDKVSFSLLEHNTFYATVRRDKEKVLEVSPPLAIHIQRHKSIVFPRDIA